MLKSQIHERAVECARKFRTCEVELIEILQQVERHKVHLLHGCSSSFEYATRILKLSTDQAYTYIGVARKAVEVPALKNEIRDGNISVTKARRLASVIDSSNQNHWLELARTSSKHQLEKEIALVNPKEAIRDQLKFVAEPVDHVSLKRDIARVQLQVGVSEELMLKIRHAQDLISQRKQTSVGLEEMLEVVMDSYIKREDPVEKAKRSKIKGQIQTPAKSPTQALPQLGPGQVQKTSASNLRAPLPAKTKHQVYLKFKGQCSHEIEGRRCGKRRLLQIHHIKPVSRGGTNDLENLILLCSGHHQVQHLDDPH